MIIRYARTCCDNPLFLQLQANEDEKKALKIVGSPKSEAKPEAPKRKASIFARHKEKQQEKFNIEKQNYLSEDQVLRCMTQVYFASMTEIICSLRMRLRFCIPKDLCTVWANCGLTAF